MKRVDGVCLAMLWVASAAAQGTIGSLAQHLDLGGGLGVDRSCWRAPRGGLTCFAWTPTGFGFGDAAHALADARVFARVPATARILALTGQGSGWPPRLLRSDDHGVHWTDQGWSGEAPALIAFDDRTLDGVASGDGGHVWSTSDGGDHWIDHGSDARIWTSIAIADHEVVLADSMGNVFRSEDGGFSRESVPNVGAPQLEQHDRFIVVRSTATECIVRHGAGTRCTPR